MLLFIFNLFTLSFSNLNNHKLLPPIKNVYTSNINIPFIGKQNIEYERIKLYESEVRLKGLINENGKIFFDKQNNNDYYYDNILQKIINKYKCELNNPYYNNKDDVIIIKFKIKLFRFTTTLLLENINSEKK